MAEFNPKDIIDIAKNPTVAGAAKTIGKKVLGSKQKWILWTVAFLASLTLLLALIWPFALGTVMSMAVKQLATGGFGNNSLSGSEFDDNFSDDCKIQGPDKSQAVRVETRKFYITPYCPETTGTNKTMEGSPYAAAGMRLALGAVAVPPFNKSNPNIQGDKPDYPWGTTFEIPGYGTGVAVDHGAAIQKAGIRNGKWPATPYDHIDIFVGWGKESCKKWGTKNVDVKVYWFDPKTYPSKNVDSFVKRICSTTANTCGAKIVARAKAELGYKPEKENHSKYLNYEKAQWRAAFTSWVYKQEGYLNSVDPSSPGLLYNHSDKLKIIRRTYEEEILNPQPGDIFGVYSASANSRTHVGIVESIDGDWIYTIEGNTSGDDVDRNKRTIKSIKALARPKNCN